MLPSRQRLRYPVRKVPPAPVGTDYQGEIEP